MFAENLRKAYNKMNFIIIPIIVVLNVAFIVSKNLGYIGERYGWVLSCICVVGSFLVCCLRIYFEAMFLDLVIDDKKYRHITKVTLRFITVYMFMGMLIFFGIPLWYFSVF